MNKRIYLQVIASIVIICVIFPSACKKTESSNTPPTADFMATPELGVPGTIFHFDASGCKDAEDVISILQVRWDWESDGIFDTDYSTNKILNYQYTQEGIFEVTLEVKDSKNLVNSTKKHIIVSAEDVPIVTTNSVTISHNSAICGGNVTSNGSYLVNARGVCWSTTPNPLISDGYTVDGNGTGNFTSNITGLSLNTQYFVRAYATISLGTAYGDERSFITVITAPIITSVIVNPSSIKIGGIVNVSVTAYDADGDALTYAYTPNGGAISGVGPSVTWIAPNTTGTYSVSVTVSDGYGGTANHSGALIVTESVTTINGTAYFPSGVSGDLSYAKVSIYTSLDNWNFNQPIKFVGATGSGASVTFSMTNVLPGNYYLDVWKDIDNSGNWTSGDFVGWYGSGGLESPVLTEFQITEGETKTINVQMYIIAKGDKLAK